MRKGLHHAVQIALARSFSTLLPPLLALAILFATTAAFGAIAPTSVSVSAAAAVAGGGLRASGNQIVDGTGQAVRLLGANRSGTEFACIQGWGFFDGPADAASIRAIKAWHTNVVRVPLNEGCWLAINGAPAAYSGAAYQRAIVDYVNLLTDNGLIAIVDLHWSGAGTAPATGQQPMPNRDHSVEFWRQVATTFKANSAVIFDLHNEPYPDSNRDTAEAWRCWRDGGSCAGVPFQVAGMQELVTTVRATGAANLILLGGVQYANALSGWLAHRPSDPANNLGASWHIYNFNLCNNPACWNANVAPVAAAVPLVAGEIGENDCAHGFVDPLMDWLDARGASYLGWTWNTWICSSGPALITSYDGTPTAFGQGLKDRLARLASAPPPPPVATATPSPRTPTPPATGGGALILYDNAFRNGFVEGTFSYSAKNSCDAATYTSPTCSYAIAYNAWGGINFIAPPGGQRTTGYKALQWTLNTHGQPLANFSVLFTDGAGNVLNQVPLSSNGVVATLPGGWVRLAVPVATLNPADVAIGSIQLKNYTGGGLPTIHVDDIQLVTATATATPTPAPTGTPLPTSTPLPTATATPVAANGLALVTPLTLDRTTVGRGATITGRVTYANTGTTTVTIRNLVIAGRPPGGTNGGGPYLDFGPGKGTTTVPPGAQVTLVATRTIAAGDPLGGWYAYSTYQDAAGEWHDAPATQNRTFRVTAAALAPAPSAERAVVAVDRPAPDRVGRLAPADLRRGPGRPGAVGAGRDDGHRTRFGMV